MEKMKMQSENLVDENVEKIGKLFPNCITEGKDENGQTTKFVDFDMLKQELSKVVVDGNDERYMLNWAGKKQSILTANSPINATLRPREEESVGKDGKAGGFDSENLYIEGDNLDVLKLLRETYLNKIKMIYIDPPYNTGNDFVYNDDFATSADEYLQNSKSYDEEGNRMVQNLESKGRFHSDWLSMMYPRLKLARDLLTDDGVIFISIDDNEQANLKKICDEIFGEHNFVSNMIWKSKSGGANDVSGIATDSENILVYCKNLFNLKMNLDSDAEVSTSYNNIDENGGRYSLDRLDKQSLGYHSSLDFPITGPDGKIYVVEHKNPNNKVARWRWSRDTVKKRYNELVFKYPYVYTKNYEKGGSIPRNLLIDERFGRSRTGKTELADLFEKISYFSFPKPTKLIKYLLKIATIKSDIVLDFFSGSATTAHAVMQLNAEDGGNRKFIMVQLPEVTDEKSEAYKAGYKNICEIGKERIRRAGKKILEELKDKKKVGPIDENNIRAGVVKQTIPADNNAPFTTTEYNKNSGEITTNHYNINNEKDKYVYHPELLDVGFRVLKLDCSNMKDVYYNPADISQDLLSQLESNIKEDRSSLDLLFQVMLDMGVMLSQKIEKRSIQGKTVYIVGEYDEENQPNLICCFDDNISEDVVTEIAKLKPIYAVFRDSSMSTDSMSVNFDQIFATHSPNTTRKVL